ncbi:MAG TPA: hypothetical protein VJY65_07310, partial [Chloroflexota bacterium]|nr:hypothetical protein [Chloroflexota bacterium]
LQCINRLKDVLGIPLSSLQRVAEVEETLDALGADVRDPPEAEQRRALAAGACGARAATARH